MSQQKQQNEPSKAAMEAAKRIKIKMLLTNGLLSETAIAVEADAAMQPEREAAEKMAEIVEHVATDGAEITPQLVAAASKALAAYEAARGK